MIKVQIIENYPLANVFNTGLDLQLRFKQSVSTHMESYQRLTSRNSGKSANILEIKADHGIVSNPIDIAKIINEHFSNVAQVLAHDIPLIDVNPASYLERTDCSFSLQTPSVSIVLSFLKKIDEKKATGLDRIPSKLLKMAASIIAPFLTSVFLKVYSHGDISK